MRQPRDARFREIGASKASEIVMLTLRMLHRSRFGDAFRICGRVRKKFVESAAASGNRCDQARDSEGIERALLKFRSASCSRASVEVAGPYFHMSVGLWIGIPNCCDERLPHGS